MPVPILVSARLPTVLRIGPLKALVTLLSPTVSVFVPAVPAALPSMVPAPDRPLIFWLKPFRSSMPTPVVEVVTVTLPTPVPEGIWLAAPSRSVADLPAAAFWLMTVSPT